MPDKQCHLAVAKRNQAVIEKLLNGGNEFPEWVAVAAFYRALHLVDAILYDHHAVKHGGSHANRESVLKRDFKGIYKHYRPLYAASLIARYLDLDRQEYGSFSGYMSADQVRRELVDFRLFHIAKMTEGFIGSIEPVKPETT